MSVSLQYLERCAGETGYQVGALEKVTRLGEMLRSPRFRTLFVGMSAILDHPISTYTRARMEQLLTAQVIESQLVPMLATSDFPDATTLVNQAWEVIEPLVQLNKDEAAYVAAIGVGELRPELLGGEDAELIERVRRHPAVQWKIRNVKEHLDGKRGRQR